MELFIVEDNHDEFLLLKEAFIEICGEETEIVGFENGEQAIHYLNDLEKEDLPDFVILDLKLPGMTGFELLRHMERNPEFSRIQRLVLTDSNREEDVKKSYDRGACLYMKKPKLFDGYLKVARTVSSLIELPQ